jgi:hypothetical protein
MRKIVLSMTSWALDMDRIFVDSLRDSTERKAWLHMDASVENFTNPTTYIPCELPGSIP